MRAGRINHRVIVERPVVTRGTSGQEATTWERFGEFWAGIEPSRGRESNQTGQVTASYDTLIVLRWSLKVNQITAKWRVRPAKLGDATVWNISSPPIHVNFNHRELHLQCSAGINRG